MKQRLYYLLLTILSFSFIQIGQGQISYGGEPYSFSQQLERPVFVQPDQRELQNIDREAKKDCSALEFGRFLPLNIGLDHDSWTMTPLNNGDRLYRLGIKSTGALAIGAYFSEFYIPEGGELFIYSPDEEQFIGSFNHLNNSKEAVFATEFLIGEELIIEYYEPKEAIGQSKLYISEILHAYTAINDLNDEKDFGQAGACEVNVNCEEGIGREDQRDAVVRILIKSGSSSFWCTGALVNNTSFDRTPYVLTADHCGKNASEEDMNLWLFYFHYQFWACYNSSTEPSRKSLRGCEKIAASSNAGIQGSDFFLVKLTKEVPVDYHPYLLGWSREGIGSEQGYTIHHPWGDVKKISTYTQALEDGNIGGGMADAYWEVFWSATESGHGVTEPGSSGSPIFNQEGNLIGTLTGGQASCSENGLTAPDYYGKFSQHWDQNGDEEDQQLMPWLDPEATGALYLDGIYIGNEEISSQANTMINVMPNPAKDMIQIQLDKSIENAWLSIYDIQGKLLEQMKLQNTTKYSVEHLKKGVYILEARNLSGSQIMKLIIE